MSEQSNTPTLSRFSASILLYFIATALISLLIGTALYAQGLLPPVVLTLAAGFNSSLGVIALLWGALVEKSFPKGIWKNAYQTLTIIASIITVFFLTLYTLGISSAPKCVSLGTCSPMAATAVAQVNATATAVAQVNATATTVAQANATATAEANAVATVIAQNPNPYPPYTGRLALYDPLSESNTRYGWAQGTSPNGGSCKFTNGAYQVLQPQKTFTYCAADNNKFVNFTYQVDMKILGGDCGGIIFHVDSQANNFYLFEVCQGGGCQIALYLNNQIVNKDLYKNFDCSNATHKGLNVTNTIAVTVKDNIFKLYLNHTEYPFKDLSNSLTEGTIGVLAQRYYDYPTNVEFNNAKVWIQ